MSPLHNLKMVNPWMWTFMSGYFDENSTFSTLVYWTFSPGGGNSCYVSMKPTEWSFHVVLCIMLNKLVLILIGCGKERSVMVRWAGQWAATRKSSVTALQDWAKKAGGFLGYGCYNAGNTKNFNELISMVKQSGNSNACYCRQQRKCRVIRLLRNGW